MTGYSFKDLAATLTHPLGSPGTFVIQGQLGAGQVTIDNTTEHTVQAVSADGNVMQSLIAGDNGMTNWEMQQVSALHIWFLGIWNAINAAMKNGDVSNAYALNATLVNKVDGTSHRCTGGGIGKIPGKPYAAQGQNITWSIPFGDVQNLTA